MADGLLQEEPRVPEKKVSRGEHLVALARAAQENSNHGTNVTSMGDTHSM
jgi:hypothetical protein